MKKITEIILVIIGILLTAGVFALAVAFSALAFLLVTSLVVISFGVVTLPAIGRTIKNRKDRKKDFKDKCKEKGINKPDMKLYREVHKESMPFKVELGLNALINLHKNDQEKKDLPIGNTIIFKEEQQNVKSFYNKFNNELVQDQLELQEKIQRTIYGYGDVDYEKYFKNFEELKALALSKSNIPGFITENQQLFEISYVGDFEGKSRVVKKHSITNPRRMMFFTKNGDSVEAFNIYTNEWQENNTITDLDQIYSLLKENGIDELVNGIKTRGQK